MADSKQSILTTIKSLIQRKDFQVIPGDLAMELGLPVEEIQKILRELTYRYHGHIKNSIFDTELYIFPHGWQYPLVFVLSQWMSQAIHWIGFWVQKIFSGWIIGFLLLFAWGLLPLRFIFKTIPIESQKKKERYQNSFGHWIALLQSYSSGSPTAKGSYIDKRSYIDHYLIKKAQHTTTSVNAGELSLIAMVKQLYTMISCFLFGEPHWHLVYHPACTIAFEHWIHHKGRIITTDEWYSFVGEPWYRANPFLMQRLLQYEGKALVTNSGSIAYVFPGAPSNPKNDGIQPEAEWIYPYEPPMVFNGLDLRWNIILGLCMSLHWVGLSLLGALVLPVLPTLSLGIGEVLLSVWLPCYLLYFALSFLGLTIPLVRIIVLLFKNRKIIEKNCFRLFVHTLSVKREKKVYLDWLRDEHPETYFWLPQSHAYLKHHLKRLSDTSVKRIINRYLSVEHGIIETDTHNRVYVDFLNFDEALKNIDTLKKKSIY